MAEIIDQWAAEDNKAACAEGWNVWTSDGSEGGPFQIQKYDEQDVFEDDVDAWMLVWTKAKAGSGVHQRALDFIKQHNQIEYGRIELACSV